MRKFILNNIQEDAYGKRNKNKCSPHLRAKQSSV